MILKVVFKIFLLKEINQYLEENFDRMKKILTHPAKMFTHITWLDTAIKSIKIIKGSYGCLLRHRVCVTAPLEAL